MNITKLSRSLLVAAVLLPAAAYGESTYGKYALDGWIKNENKPVVLTPDAPKGSGNNSLGSVIHMNDPGKVVEYMSIRNEYRATDNYTRPGVIELDFDGQALRITGDSADDRYGYDINSDFGSQLYMTGNGSIANYKPIGFNGYWSGLSLHGDIKMGFGVVIIDGPYTNNVTLYSGNYDFAGVNTFTGGLLVRNGASLYALQDRSLGAGSVEIREGGKVTIAVAAYLGMRLSGAGTIESGGTMTLAGGGTASFSGTAKAPTVNFGDRDIWGGMRGGRIEATTAVNLNSEVSGILSTVIAGTATLTKNGAGVVVLSVINTYTGHTTVAAGTLALSGGLAIPDAGSVSLTGNGTLRLDFNETIKSLTGTTGSTTLSLQTSALTLADQAAGTFYGTITGTAGSGLVKNGTAKWIFAGDGSGFNGLTTIGGGSLQLGNGGITGSLGAGAIVNNGQLVLNRSGDVTLANVISGSGSLTKIGTNATILTGNNTYSGGTTISSGVLQIGDGGSGGSLDGAVNVGASGRLVINKSSDYSFYQRLRGSGRVTQMGTGNLQLAGLEYFTGKVDAVSGSLMIGEDFGPTSVGDVTIGGSAILKIRSLVAIDRLMTSAGSVTEFDIGVLTLGSGDLYGNLVFKYGTVFGKLIKSGTGSLSIYSQSKIYDYEVEGGALTFGLGSELDARSNVKIAAGTTVNFNGNASVTIATLSGEGKANLAANTGLTITDTGAFSGVIEGAGSLTKAGTGALTLSGANTYKGVTTVSGGVLEITGTTKTPQVAITTGGTLRVSGGNALTNTALVTSDARGTFNVLTTERIGSLSGEGVVTLASGAILIIDNAANATYAGNIVGDGALTKVGRGTWTLSGNNTYEGDTNVGIGTLTLAGGNAIADTGYVYVYSNGTLRLAASERIGRLAGTANTQVVLDSYTLTTGDALNTTFAGVMSGTGGLTKLGTGMMTLGGANTYTGATQVDEGTLQLTGSSASAMTTVAAGATFRQTGTLAGATLIRSGGVLTGAGTTTGAVTIEGGGTFRVDQGLAFTTGSLTLADTSVLQVSLGAPTDAASFVVNGDLTLDGRLEITNAGGFGKGVYRLFDYTGALTDNGLVVTKVTGGVTVDPANLAIQSGAGQVNLVSNVGGQFVFWDGANTSPNNVVEGGSGTWNTTASNWTLSDGSANGAFVSAPEPGFAVFQGAAGVVTVSNTAGAVKASGMQFAVTGYALAGDALTLVNDNDEGFATIRVGDGPLLRTPMSATIGVVLQNDGGVATNVVKTDLGTLILTADNTYTGTTTIAGGVLQLGDGGATGALAGGAIINDGALVVNRSNALTLAQNISGTGGFTKLGAGVATLSGTNTYEGATVVTAGTLALAGGDAIWDTGAVEVAAGATLSLGASETIGTLTGAAGATLALAGNHLTFGDATDTTFAGTITGTGGLIKLGAGTATLSGDNTFSGATTLSEGALILSGGNSITGLMRVAANTTLQIGVGGATGTFGNGNLSNEGALIVDRTGALALSGAISGRGTLTKRGEGVLTLSGANTYTGLTTVEAGTLVLAGGAALDDAGALWLTNGSLRLDASERIGSLSGFATSAVALQSYVLTVGDGDDTEYAGVIFGTGGLTKRGSGTMTLSGNNTFTGLTSVNDGVLLLSGGSALGGGDVLLGGGILRLAGSETAGTVAGTSAIELQSHTLTAAGAASTVYSGEISGTGGFTKAGAGTLTLSGASTYTGATQVDAGTLAVTGSLATGTVAVASGATLTGTGTITGAVTIADGAHLANGSGQTLTTGALTLSASSQVDVLLGAPSATGLFSVNGDLTLDGELNITASGAFGKGVYRLFDYTGTLTNNGLALGLLPSGAIASELEVQTSAGKQVNLVSNVAGQFAFWDGANTVGDGTVAGGTGVWDTTSTNWTRSDGSVNGQFANTPQAGFAIFQGDAGVVTISNADGDVAATGMQFTTNGYSLVGDALTLVNDATSGFATIRVGDGPSTVTPMIATLGVVLQDDGATASHLTKLDPGTLVLTGTNTYTGGTTIEAGILQLGDGGASGSILGDIVNDGTLVVKRSDAFTLGNVISGKGGFTQAGAGETTLSATNTYEGATSVAAGTLVLAGGSAVSDLGAVSVAAGATLRLDDSETIGRLSGAAGATVELQANVLTLSGLSSAAYSGAITGTGSVVKNGYASLTLEGDSTYTGPTLVNDGDLVLNGSLTSAIIVADGASLSGGGVTTGAVVIADGATLSHAEAAALTTGDLTLSDTSQVYVTLGAPGATGVFQVVGDLVLDGVLNITDGGAFGKGVYRIFDYSGGLTDNGLTFGMVPTDPSALLMQTSIVGQVNVVSGIGGETVFWDGATTTSNGVINGGSGTWTTTGTNWTDVNGSTNATFGSPGQTGFAIFQGVAGVVTIDNSAGEVTATGMQFATDGYVLTGDALTLTNDPAAGVARIRVGDGTSSVLTATIDAVIQDDAADAVNLVKIGAGTLVFTAENTYVGTTTVAGGTLQIGDGGTTGSLGAGATTVNAGATLAYDRSDAVTFDRVISGDGKFAQVGAGNLTVTGANTHTGGTQIAATSTLSLNATGALGTGDVANEGVLRFDSASAKTFANAVTGTGDLLVDNVGPVTLTGTSTYTGATQIATGASLILTGELGATAVTVDGTLSGSGTIGGAVDITASGTLLGTVGQTLTVGDLTFQGATSTLDVTLPAGGAGSLVAVNGDLTLAGTVNISSAGTLDYGLYRVLGYTGTLTDNGMVIGSVSGGQNPAEFALQTGVANSVNILKLTDSGSGSGFGDVFWNGAGSGGGVIAGGGGTWSADGSNWTSVNGVGNGTQGSGFLIFQGTGGAILVDGSAGAIGAPGHEVTGMQFVSNGYYLFGDAIRLTNDATLGYATLRVGDGIAGSGISTTIGVALTGDANVRKTDFGTLTLGGANSYLGSTAVMGGTLQLGDGGVNGSIAASSAVTVAQDATLAFSRSDTLTFANTIDGAGTVVQRGLGTVILTADSARTGATRVESGVLQIGDATTGGRSGSLGSGDVTLAGGTKLFFDRVDTTTVANRIGGAGQVEVRNGSLTFTGDNTYTGMTSVRGGAELRLAANSSTASTVVYENALLGGTGTVRGNLVNYGTVSPGFSPGTLTVVGDYIQGSTGVLKIEIESATSFDKVVVGGVADLDGSIKLTVSGYSLVRTDTFTVLTAAGGVTGSLTLDAPIYVAAGMQVTVNPNDVTLSFAAGPNPGPILADLSPNQTATGNTVVQLVADGKAPGLVSAVAGLNTSQLVGVLNTLSPQSMDRWWANLRHNTVAMVRSAEGRMDRLADMPKHGLEFWTHANQRESQFRGNVDEQKARGSASGVTVGVDAKPIDDLRIGALFQFGYERIMTSMRTNVEHYSAAAYARYDLPLEFKEARVFIDGIAGFGYGDYDTKRSVNIPGYYRTAVSSTGAWDNFANLRLGVETDIHGVKFTPYIAAAYTRYSVSGYSERDADNANLSISGMRAESLAMRLGFSLESPFTVSGYTVSPSLNVAWRHEYADKGMNIGTNLAGSQYTIRGAGAKTDGLEAAFALNVKINEHWSAYGSIGAYVDGDAGSSQNYQLGVGYRF